MRKNKKGFTIIELLVVIVIIGILAAISIVGFLSIQQNARNTQRSSQLRNVAEALEKYYMKNGEYPSCAMMTQSSSTVVANVLPGLDPSNLTAPLAASGTNSFQCTSPTSPAQFGYLVGVTSYTLQYQEEGTANVDSVYSRHQAYSPNYTLTLVAGTGGTVSGGGSFAAGSLQTITATNNAGYRFLSWSGPAVCTGTSSHTLTLTGNITCTANFLAQYTLTVNAGNPDGTVSGGGGSYDSGSFQTITATANANDVFVSWTGTTGCSSVTSSTQVTMTSNMTCTANFTPVTPSVPVVSANTVGSTTTWSWPAITCPGSGQTASYQYDYQYQPAGFNSGWTATASTSVAFTTSTQGQTYYVYVQAKCTDSYTSGGWSGSGSASYYSPYWYTLTLAGSNCTLSGAGSYVQQAVASISCTPSSGYFFDYWSGCTVTSSTSASTTITMNANTTCTATSTRWIPGANGDLVGIYVYYKDQSSLLQWKTNTNAETNTYSILGSDPTALTKRVLKDPEVYSLTWTTYPAESSCNAINGRLPMEGEVASIMANEGAYNQYGSFGSLSTNYWGADETTDYDTTEAAGRSSTTGNYTNSGKTNSYAVRCVADTPS